MEQEWESSDIAVKRFNTCMSIVRLEGVISSSSLGAVVDCLSSMGQGGVSDHQMEWGRTC